MAALLENTEVIHLWHSLGALDSFCFARGTQVDHPTPAFSEMLLLALYPSPWDDLKAALHTLVAPTGRGIDEAKIVGGKMGLRLVWQALTRSTGLDDEWDRDDAAHWCKRLSGAIDAWLVRAKAAVAAEALTAEGTQQAEVQVKGEPDVDMPAVVPATPLPGVPSVVADEPEPARRPSPTSPQRCPSPSSPPPKRRKSARGPFSGTPPAPPASSSSRTPDTDYAAMTAATLQPPPTPRIALAEASRATYGFDCHLPPALARALNVRHLTPPLSISTTLSCDFIRTAPRDGSHPPDFGHGNARTVGQHFCLAAAMNFGPSTPGAPFVTFADTTTLATWRDTVNEKGPAGMATFLSTPHPVERTKNAWLYQGNYRESSQGIVTAEEIHALSTKGKGIWGEVLAAHFKVEKSKIRVGKDKVSPSGKPSFMQSWGFASTSAGGAMLELEAGGSDIKIAYATYVCVGFDEDALASWVATRAKRIEKAVEAQE